MPATIRYLAGQYGFPPGFDHIATVRDGEKRLREMAADVLASGDLVGIYIPEGAEGGFSSHAERGRIVGAVRLVALPLGSDVRDYSYPVGDPNPQWPVGWPCHIAFAPPPATCPMLRNLVDAVFGPGNLQPYAARLRHGPLKLESKMVDRINREFAAFLR